MAAAIRLKFTSLAQKFVCSNVFSNIVKKNIIHRVSFHNSSCLNGNLIDTIN